MLLAGAIFAWVWLPVTQITVYAGMGDEDKET